MVVLGENQKFAAALIHPDMTYLKDFCKRHEIAYTDDASLLTHADVKAIFNKELKKFNPLFAHHEQIKAYELVSEEWSVDNGILTPTLKVKRNIIQQRYKDLIDKLFE